MAEDQVPPCTVTNVSSFGGEDTSTGASTVVKDCQFQVLLLRISPEKAVGEHSVDGPIIVQCLEGVVDFSVEGNPQRMEAGDWMHLPGGTPHAVMAHEDARLLVTRLMKS